jgi:hypothetical protein
VGIDYAAGSRFALEGVAGEHPVHDSVTKSYRHLNFFQHECVPAVDRMRRIEQRTDKSLKRLRWSLLKGRAGLRPEAAADLDALIARMATVRTARAWSPRSNCARSSNASKQINVVRAMPRLHALRQSLNG